MKKITKKTKIIIAAIVILLLLALLAAGLYVSYFVLQVPLFDRSGWYVTDIGATQYLDYYAKPLTGWQTIDGKLYYFGADGAMQTGWLNEEGKTYYLSSDGTLSVGWLETDGNRYYFDANGVLFKDGWLQLPEGTYLIGTEGQPLTGWVERDGLRYYLNEDGIRDERWQDTAAGLTYVENGEKRVGWLDAPEGKFYFNEEGVSQSGWITDKLGRYYLHGDGTFATGFVEINGIERYFLPTGEYVILCNPWNPVPEDYQENLVKVGSRKIDAYCYDALMEMSEAAKKDGYTIQLNSAYRSLATQTRLFTERVAAKVATGMSQKDAEKLVATSTAVPGTSEHQTGLAVDIMSNRVYKWLASNSWKYGFIVRYPDDKMEITGIIYEPWHLRYVGKEMAKDIYESGLCLEEYLEMLKQK